MKLRRLFFKTLKVAIGLMLTLAISLLITALVVLYNPTLFKWSLETLETVADDATMEIYTQEEFLSVLNLPSDFTDEQLFNFLASQPGRSRQERIFFARSLMIKKPDGCQYAVYGKHNQMDVYWVVEGDHCKHRRDKKDKDKRN